MIQFSKIVTRRTVFNKLSCKDTEYKDYRYQPYTVLKATKGLKLPWNNIHSEQSDGCRCVYASVKARRPPYGTHGNFNASSRLPDKYHWGAGADNYCLSFVGTQAWRRDFHRRWECSVSDPRGSKHWPLMSQVVSLARLETGLVQKKWSESRIAGVVR